MLAATSARAYGNTAGRRGGFSPAAFEAFSARSADSAAPITASATNAATAVPLVDAPGYTLGNKASTALHSHSRSTIPPLEAPWLMPWL